MHIKNSHSARSIVAGTSMLQPLIGHNREAHKRDEIGLMDMVMAVYPSNSITSPTNKIMVNAKGSSLRATLAYLPG